MVRNFILNIVFFACMQCNSMQWRLPYTGKDVQTVFFQGMMCSQWQAAKYTDSQVGLHATTGETVIVDNANPIIRNPYIGKELDEIILKCSKKRAWYNPYRIVDRIQHYAFARQTIKYGTKIANMIPGMPSVKSHAVDFFKLNFGQERDMQEHLKKVLLCRKYFNDRDMAFFGPSRGAAATFNAVAKYKKKYPKLYENLKLIILEGCFDSVMHTITERTPTLLKKVYVDRIFNYLLSKVTEYKSDGPSPLGLVDDFPEDIPIAFITSKSDTNVSKACTDVLIQALQKRNKNPIHTLVLDNAGHNSYSLGNSSDQQKYLQFIHNLYKQYDLPHIPKYIDTKL